ncbi:MAG: hypothetical protein Q8M92_09415, partial [Candidatus Subteraquimicrobiales bacterium]|nr:hypothetical protein [Candidatus Subteraquimicrobiales bacterium]
MQILPTDKVIDVLSNMSEGNAGALNVMAQVIKHGKNIDPYAEPILIFGLLEEWKITGHKIWELYKNVCGE